MVLDSGEIIIFAAMFGLLVGIVWSLRYIVSIDRKIEAMDEKVAKMLGKRKK